MKKAFISYKYTHVPIKEIHELIDPIYDFLSNHYITFCNIYKDDEYKKNKYTTKMIMHDVLYELSCANVLFVIIENTAGTGMMIEFGYAIKQNIPIILIINKKIKYNTLRELSTKVIEYEHKKEIKDKLLEHIKENYNNKNNL